MGLDSRIVRAITAITVTGLLSGRLAEAAWVLLLLFATLTRRAMRGAAVAAPR